MSSTGSNNPLRIQCRHCLLEVDETEAIAEKNGGGDYYFCCAGCQGVYHILKNTGLDEFYNRRRDWKPGPPPDQISIEPEAFADHIAKHENLLEIDFTVTSIRCASCVWLIEHYLNRLDGIVSARVNYATHRARVKWDPAKISLEDILKGLMSIGYAPRPVSFSDIDDRINSEKKDLLIRFGTASFFSMQLMAFTVALYAGFFQGMEDKYRTAFQFISWALCTPVMFYSGWPFVVNSLRSIRNLVLNMDVLVFMGTFSAYVYSIAVIFTGGEVYFDTTATIITLILLGRYIETGARGKASEAVAALMGLQPKEAKVLHGDPAQGYDSMPRRLAAITNLKDGDIIEVIPGEKIPLDGVVLSGASEVDESMLTGESRHISKKDGANVYAGTMNLNGRLIFRAGGNVRETVLSKIIKAVEDAQTRKAPIQALADKVVGWFVPVVLAIAALTFVIWYFKEPSSALMNAVSVLVIACPCALGLATPLAVLVGSTIASRLGVVVKGGDILEAASKIDTIVLDKTGTITKGRPSLTDYVELMDNLMPYAASLEAASEHTIGRAICEAAKKQGASKLKVDEFKAVAGKGVMGIVDNSHVMIGNEEFLSANGVIDISEKLKKEGDRLSRDGKTVVYASIDRKSAGLFAVSDSIRPEAGDMVDKLKKRGLKVMMVTGDSAEVASYVSKEVGIGEFTAGVSPMGKAETVRNLQSSGRRVMMAGDGINDAPALVEAAVGIAVGRATDIALESADMVVMKDDLGAIVGMVDLSKRSLSIIRQNLFWAFSYNFIAIPLAVAGVMHPVVSAIAMAISSLLVVGNSLRLRKI